MDKLKDFIDKNRDAFDNDMLPEGHLERFIPKLPHSKRSKQIRLYSLVGAIAAAVAMLVLVLDIPTDSGWNNPAEIAVSETDDHELKELRLYYNMQMNSVLSQMETLYKTNNTPGTAELIKETKRVLADNYMFEETVLPTLPSSNIGLYAMTQHYNTSLESLSFMLRQMQNVTNRLKD